MMQRKNIQGIIALGIVVFWLCILGTSSSAADGWGSMNCNELNGSCCQTLYNCTELNSVETIGNWEDVYVGTICDPMSFFYDDDSDPTTAYKTGCCTGETCLADYAFNVSLPEYLEPSIGSDWGEQENQVIICGGCEGEIIPARGKLVVSGDTLDCQKYTHDLSAYCGCESEAHDLEIEVKRQTYWTAAAYFNGNIFEVGGSRESPVKCNSLISTQWNLGEITLVNKDCETLKKALNAKVYIWAQKWQSVEACYINHSAAYDCAPGANCPASWKSQLGDPILVATVDVVAEPSEFMKELCPGPASPFTEGTLGPEGFGTSDPGSAPPPENDNENPPDVCNSPTAMCMDLEDRFSAGNTELGGGWSKREKVQGNYGSVNDFDASGEIEVNVGGFWFRAAARPDWTAITTNMYKTDAQNNITQIVFDVKEYPKGILYSSDHYIYHYESSTGTWDNDSDGKAAARAATRGKIQLKHIYDSINSVTRNTFAYHGTSGNALTQTGYDSGGTVNGYVVYEYVDPNDWDSALSRIWSGNDLAKYGSTPTGGRWVDLAYDTNGMLTHFKPNCDSCGGERYYAYTESQLKSGDYLLTQVKDAAETVLVSYAYDSQDRITQRQLGTSVPVTDWIYEDFEFDSDDPDHPQGQTVLLRRDYVSDTQYQTSIYLADPNGMIASEYHYHDLQSSENLTGPYSVIKYSYDTDANGKVTKATTILPQGNKLYTYYDPDGGIISRQRKNAYGDPVTITEGQYTYTANNLISLSINRRGATTDYDYDYSNNGNNLIKRTDPDPDTGSSSGGTHQITEYLYDGENRLTMEWRKDSSGTNNITSKYNYDTHGNLTQTIEDFGTGKLNLTTTYAYNEYNQLTQVTDPESRIRKTFYSDSGVVIGRAVYEDADDVISATRYSYNSNGKLEYLSVVKSDTTFTDSALQNDLSGETPQLTWIDTKYLYDAYGRRTAVIADSGGENLTTTYVYDNLSRVYKTIRPDTRFTEIVRDGRGLVTEEITGINGVGKATTKYAYDFNGNLLQKKNPLDKVMVTYKYDQFDRLVGEYRGF